MSTAVLLIAHGSRRPSANQDLVEVARRVADAARYDIVEVAYLELAMPEIRAGGQTCVERGAARVLMFPYFLAAGEHVVRDLETHRGELAAAHPGVEFVLCPPLGLHPLMIEIVLDRIAEGHSSRPPLPLSSPLSVTSAQANPSPASPS